MNEWICNLPASFVGGISSASPLSLFQALSLLLGLGGLWIFVHCGAMCGPIVTSLGYRPKQIFVYQLGRASVYAVFGALAAWVGKFLFWDIKWLKVLIVMSFVGLAGWQFKKSRKSDSLFSQKWLRFMSRFLKRTASTFFIGQIFALLPCSLTFWVLGLAAATRQPLTGAIVMVSLVVVSTLPLLAAQLIGRPLIFRFPQVQAFVLLISALLIAVK